MYNHKYKYILKLYTFPHPCTHLPREGLPNVFLGWAGQDIDPAIRLWKYGGGGRGGILQHFRYK
jgi:hypothetical protein